MSLDQIRQHISTLRADISGDYASVSRVVDGLLDLRLLATGRDDLVHLVDETMATIPGRTVAPNEWWRGELDHIELEALSFGTEDETSSGQPPAGVGAPTF